MPNMDGLEALKVMKEYDPTARIAMCTAMGQQSIVIEALETYHRLMRTNDARRLRAWQLD